MKRNFGQAKKFLETKFPELKGKVTGDNYPIPPVINLMTQLLTGAQLLTMALMVFGDGLWTNILRLRGVPSWYYSVKQYGFQLGVAIFFIVPQILNKWIITGAFEIIVDEETKFSKLETGRMPSSADLEYMFERLGMKAEALS